MPNDKREAEVKEVVFGKRELDPEQEAEYLEKIKAAKKGGINALKGKTPLGHVERPAIPDLSHQGNPAALPTGLVDGGVQPRPPGSPLLSSSTAAQLEQAMKAQVEEKPAAVPEPEIKKEELTEELLDVFNFDSVNTAERILNNKKRREEIEKRCSEMKFEDLLVYDEVRQTVPIRADGKFTVVYRSLKPDESLFLKEYVSKMKASSEAYALEKFSLCQLTCSVVKINDVELPSHLDKNGEPDEKLFELKLRKLIKKSGYIVADLAVNYAWFDIRIRKLLTDEGALGNG